MAIALSIIFFVVLALVLFTTLAGIILVVGDIDNRVFALEAGISGFCAIGWIATAFPLAVISGYGVAIVIVGVISIIAVLITFLTHVFCVIASESQWFGWAAFMSDILAIAGLIAMTILGLIG